MPNVLSSRDLVSRPDNMDKTVLTYTNIRVLIKNICRNATEFISTMILERLQYHYVNVSVLIKFSQKTSVFTLIIISSP